MREEIDGFLVVPDNADSPLRLTEKSVKSSSSSVLSQDLPLNLEQAHSFNA